MKTYAYYFFYYLYQSRKKKWPDAISPASAAFLAHIFVIVLSISIIINTFFSDFHIEMKYKALVVIAGLLILYIVERYFSKNDRIDKIESEFQDLPKEVQKSILKKCKLFSISTFAFLFVSILFGWIWNSMV